MSDTPANLRAFVERLMACDAKGKKSTDTATHSAFTLIEKLRLHMATLMGNAGFCALLSRALTLAKAEVPSLRAVKVKPDGTLDTTEFAAKGGAEAGYEGGVALLAQLLGLLVIFIGEALTLRLVGEVWPKLSFNDLNKGDKNEKAK